MKDFELFFEAAKELDSIIQDGTFGESAIDLLNQRDQDDYATYCYKGILDMFENAQYGTENVIGITFRLIKLYSDALNVSSQEPVDVLTAFIKGTQDHPELECLSSNTEFILAKTSYDNLTRQLGNKPNTTNTDVRQLATVLLSAYSKGVELVGKAFTQLLTLAQIVNNQPHDLYSNSVLSIYEKTKQFKELASDEYKPLADVIDRKIRNADAHLNAYFSVEKSSYIMKRTIKNGRNTKTEVFEVSAEDMILKIFPQVCWFSQGYIASCLLLVLVYSDKQKYDEAVKYIMRLKKSA